MRNRLAASIILYNRDGDFLLHLRDNKPEILFPNYWGLLGDFVNEFESPDRAIVRVVKEKIGFDLKSFNLFSCYNWKWFNVFVYGGLIDVPIQKFNVKDGQLKFFKASELLNLNLAYDYKNVLREYLRTKK
jgi:NADH pyrophosphatase NudC (nudix superfamily)